MDAWTFSTFKLLAHRPGRWCKTCKTLDTDSLTQPKDLEKYSHTEAQGAQRKKKQKNLDTDFIQH